VEPENTIKVLEFLSYNIGMKKVWEKSFKKFQMLFQLGIVKTLIFLQVGSGK
jgi:hypothetical protein